MKLVYEEFDRATGGRFTEAARSAAERTYYQTMVNLRRFDEILKPEYKRYYRELGLRTRFFIQFEKRAPGIYRGAQRLLLK